MLNRNDGFTLVEVVVALTIFSAGVLGLGATGAAMIRSAIELETRELAVQAIDDRINTVTVDPRYGVLDSLYAGTETGVLGQFTRTTTVTHTQTAVNGGGTLDYKTISVVVSGGRLEAPMSRSTIVAVP